ncbi:MAG: alpha/beta hydrolase, partial [Burkholderiales bacterium]
MRRMLGELLIPLGIAYGAVLLLVFLFQSHLVFFPGTGREAVLTPQSYGLRFESVRIVTADGETLDAWWVPAERARGVVLFFHGNAGNISHRIDYLQMFHRLRYSTLIVDYRGYGKSTGTPSEAGTYRDAEAAWEHLLNVRAARPQDIVIAGESLGAAVATWLAAQVAPRAVLLFSAFTSVNDLGAQVYWFLPVRLLSRIGYDNLANLTRIRAPVFIAHSHDDDIVPYA